VTVSRDIERFDLLMALVDEQAPALMNVGGVIYEGHVQACLQGRLTVVARPYGTRDIRKEFTWALAEVIDIDRLRDDVPSEPEDPLVEHARGMAVQAEVYDGLSLAERLLEERNRGRGGQHGS
jgi:hypothetical protein